MIIMSIHFLCQTFALIFMLIWCVNHFGVYVIRTWHAAIAQFMIEACHILLKSAVKQICRLLIRECYIWCHLFLFELAFFWHEFELNHSLFTYVAIAPHHTIQLMTNKTIASIPLKDDPSMCLMFWQYWSIGIGHLTIPLW